MQSFQLYLIYFFISLCCFFPVKITAQTYQLTLYQTESGLSSNLTKDVMQDKWGFIWIASDEGVSRFDGRSFLNFKKELPTNYTKRLYKTRDGRLLIINDLGILEAISKPDTVIFRTLLQGTNNALDEKKIMYPKEAFEDCKGNIWISEPGSILKYNNGTTKRYNLPANLLTTVYTRSFSFVELGCGRLYVAAFVGEILYYNPEKDIFEIVKLSNEVKINKISAIFPVNNHTLWVGDQNGIIEIIIGEKNEARRLVEISGVSAITSDGFSDFWVGTWEKGLHKLENIGGKWQIRKFWESRSPVVNHFLCDKQKNLWVATDDGLELLSPNAFARLKLNKDKASSYIQGIVSEKKAGEGAYIADQDAIYKVTKKGKNYLKGEIFKRGGILSVAQTSNKLFFGTGDDKLLVYEKEQVKEINMKPYGNAIFFLQTDKQNNVWVCQYGERKSLACIDDNLKITQYTEKNGLNTFVEVVRVDKKGNIYVGGQGKDTYLYKFNKEKKQFENISIPTDKILSQTMFKVNDFCIDEEKIWLGTTQGLYLYEKGALKQIDLGKKYNAETIKAVLLDQKQNLWLGINLGVIKYKNNQVVLFEKVNGLSSVSIALRGFGQTAEGNLLVATSNGLNYMLGQNEDPKKTPKPIFKTLKVNDKNVILHEKTEENHLQEFQYQSTLKATFVSFTFPNERVLYQYKIEGLTKDWSEPTTQDQITLERLPAGKFRLQIRAKQQGNFIWSDAMMFEFTILSPWYVRWWAWVMYVLLALTLVYFIVKLNTYRLQRQKNLLTIEITKATQEIAEQNKNIAAQAESLAQTNKELSVQRDALESAYRIIERKNVKILDSIRYAQTIQQIILPSHEYINQLCQESFVMYKPRDVVSGDFYWAYKQENKWFLAVVDCTGHGVPGAFMSMIAYSLLYRAIKVKKTYNPARILELLHVETRVVLRQKDGINTDGMDLCLCVLEENKYNPGEYSLIYAGAKRPLYLVKENQFIILEECRKSVGGFQSKNIQFENRQITIKKGDTLYLTTDGLADQNNVQRKKITEKKVQEFIKDNIHKSLNEQYQELEKILNQHQEGTEQRDDITVMAIKL